MKRVYFFEKICCGPSAGQGLLDFIQKRFGEQVETKAFDLSKAKGMLPIPGSLMMKIQTQGLGCLPALVVDNVVVAEGRIPNFLEAVELVQTGKSAAAPVAAPAAKTGCC
jgi:hypothetical protein